MRGFRVSYFPLHLLICLAVISYGQVFQLAIEMYRNAWLFWSYLIVYAVYLHYLLLCSSLTLYVSFQKHCVITYYLLCKEYLWRRSPQGAAVRVCHSSCYIKKNSGFLFASCKSFDTFVHFIVHFYFRCVSWICDWLLFPLHIISLIYTVDLFSMCCFLAVQLKLLVATD